MTPEKYIERSAFYNGYCDNSFNEQTDHSVVTTTRAINAVEMAREEIKEKAIMAHRKCCECYNSCGGTCDDHDDSEWNTLCVNHNCEYIKEFINKLNQ